VTDADDLKVLMSEMVELITEIDRLNYQTRILGINIAVESAKQSGDIRRAMELVARGVTDMADAYSAVIERIEQRHPDQFNLTDNSPVNQNQSGND
jgi:hypothetical protein